MPSSNFAIKFLISFYLVILSLISANVENIPSRVGKTCTADGVQSTKDDGYVIEKSGGNGGQGDGGHTPGAGRPRQTNGTQA